MEACSLSLADSHIFVKLLLWSSQVIKCEHHQPINHFNIFIIHTSIFNHMIGVCVYVSVQFINDGSMAIAIWLQFIRSFTIVFHLHWECCAALCCVYDLQSHEIDLIYMLFYFHWYYYNGHFIWPLENKMKFSWKNHRSFWKFTIIRISLEFCWL